MATELLVGGRIYSPASFDATAMAVTDGTVVWVGADRPGRALHPDAEVINLDGAFVAPAFVDAHVHITALGLELIGLDLSAARSASDCLTLLREFVAANRDGIVWGHGWDDTDWPDGPRRCHDLDDAAPGRLVYLTRVDAHSAICSSALLAATPGVETAIGFSRSALLRADAHHQVRRTVLGAIGPAQRAKARAAALDAAARTASSPSTSAPVPTSAVPRTCANCSPSSTALRCARTGASR